MWVWLLFADNTDCDDDPVGSGLYLVLRGGSYYGDPGDCRSANRNNLPVPTTTNNRFYGFRLALLPGQ